MTAQQYVRLEINAIQRFITQWENEFAAHPTRHMYYNIDHTRRYLAWYQRKNHRYLQ